MLQYYTSFLSVSNIPIEDWTGSNPGYQHLDRVVHFSVIIIFVWSIEYEGSKRAYSSHYLWHEITVSTPLNNANKADDKWKVLS